MARKTVRPGLRLMATASLAASLLFVESGTGREPSLQATGSSPEDRVLVSFENGIPCSDCSDNIGFRKQDVSRGKLVPDGANRTSRSMRVAFDARNIDLYLQGDVRRKYLRTGSETYRKPGPNILSFMVKLPAGSPLAGASASPEAGHGKGAPNTMTVMTYHWRPGDHAVGGASNRSLLTDSNMHGYCKFGFKERAAGRWVKVSLSPSAFRMSRNYFHFYAAQAVTDDLELFSSLRQLQWRVEGRLDQRVELQIDEIAMETRRPTASFDKGFLAAQAPAGGGDFALPVSVTNPTDRPRRYRFAVSSFLGAPRELLNGIAARFDDLAPMRNIQETLGADGGTGAAELVAQGDPAGKGAFREIVIPAGGTWKGKLVHHLKPEMLGPEVVYRYRDALFPVRRDTLTTSVVLWDPDDPANAELDFLSVDPHNSDDGNHPAPPGFPRQQRPPKGWRSEDIPYNQVGGYFVSVLTLTR